MTIQNLNMGDFDINNQNKRHPLIEDLDLSVYARRIVVFMPTEDAIHSALKYGQDQLNGLASEEVIRKVVSYNPNSLWAICRREKYDARHPQIDGFVALLFLRKEGLKQLAEGTLNRSDPDLSLLARPNERPAGIYNWCMCIKPKMIGGIALVYERFSSPLYKDVSLYSWSPTPQGRRLVESIGFTPGAPLPGAFASQLHIYARGKDAEPKRPSYDTYKPGVGGKSTTVTIARTMEDLAKVFSIRSAVYIAEQDCPYEEEFDGNDLSGTQLIGYIGDQPVGCLRIRYFGTFAKMERLAVRHEYRRSSLAFKLVRAGIDLCLDKGFREIYGHARKDLINFWSRFGFERLPDHSEFFFSDVTYVEMGKKYPYRPGSVSVDDGPLKLIRPEGRWDIPGVLDKSMSRGVSK